MELPKRGRYYKSIIVVLVLAIQTVFGFGIASALGPVQGQAQYYLIGRLDEARTLVTICSNLVGLRLSASGNNLDRRR
jgi:hypothetical protein